MRRKSKSTVVNAYQSAITEEKRERKHSTGPPSPLVALGAVFKICVGCNPEIDADRSIPKTESLCRQVTQKLERLTLRDNYKIVVLGAAGVGKTALVNRFLYGVYKSEYLPTVEELHHGVFDIQGSYINVDFVDTSGSYSFPAMRRLNIAKGDAFILMYSVQDKSSFEQLLDYRNQVVEVKGEDAPVIVVGNQADVADEERVIPSALGEATASVEWGHAFVEVSAKEDSCVEVFKELLRISQNKLPHFSVQRPKMRQRKSFPKGPSEWMLKYEQAKHQGSSKVNNCKVS